MPVPHRKVPGLARSRRGTWALKGEAVSAQCPRTRTASLSCELKPALASDSGRLNHLPSPLPHKPPPLGISTPAPVWPEKGNGELRHPWEWRGERGSSCPGLERMRPFFLGLAPPACSPQPPAEHAPYLEQMCPLLYPAPAPPPPDVHPFPHRWFRKPSRNAFRIGHSRAPEAGDGSSGGGATSAPSRALHRSGNNAHHGEAR